MKGGATTGMIVELGDPMIVMRTGQSGVTTVSHLSMPACELEPAHANAANYRARKATCGFGTVVS
jgi:hypothetical protein